MGLSLSCLSATSPWSGVRAVRGIALAALLVTGLVVGCTAGEMAAPITGGGPQLVLAPVLSLEGAAAGTPQADALIAAFNKVDRFRLVIKRASNGVVVKDTTITVTPGQSSYALAAGVPVAVPNEQFLVTITALQGGSVLFESDPVPVAAVPQDAPDGGAVTPQIALRFAGEGARATGVTVSPPTMVLGPTGLGTLAATATGAGGEAIVDVPLVWSTGSDAVVTVDENGQLRARGEGAVRVTATTPTGLAASAWIYVVGGEIAFAQSGHVRTRSVAPGGSAGDLGGSGASGPTYGAGGGVFAWSDGGRVFVNGGSVADGAYPSISPDGSKVAMERGGRIWYTNLDGSNPTQGPTGGKPVWQDGSNLLLDGGAVQRIKADGTGRSTIAAGSLPALGAAGQIAFVAGGALQIQGRGTVLDGATGRPTWSPNGRWLVVPSGGDLKLVDASGAAPAAPLGITGGTDPVWRGVAPSGTTPGPSVSAFTPDPAVPGGEVRFAGGGFDWIIPTNTQVTFPGAAGELPATMVSVTESAVTAIMPSGVVSGTIRVRTPRGTASLTFAPRVGSIHVRATKRGGGAIAGAPITVTRGAEAAGSGRTGADGSMNFDLPLGTYVVAIGAPDGYRATGIGAASVELGVEARDVGFEFAPIPARATLDNAIRTLVAGTTESVTATVLDATGAPITSFGSISWGGTGRLSVSGSGVTARVTGVQASAASNDAEYRLTVDGAVFSFRTTVTGFVAGSVTEGGRAASGISMQLRRSGGELVAMTTTNGIGGYRFDLILAGDYLVQPSVISKTPNPIDRHMTVGATPGFTGQDFTLTTGGAVGPVRAKVMLCSYSSRPIAQFMPEGYSFEIVSGCAPGADVQAMFITRSGSPTQAAIQTYLDGGGIVITEWDKSAITWQQAFNTPTSLGAWNGWCWDVIPSVYQYNAGDAFWQQNTFRGVDPNQTGCGYNMSAYSGIIPLVGWNSSTVALGYRDRGPGRVWAVEWDWQDNETYLDGYAGHIDDELYMNRLFGYMILHRGLGAAAPPSLRLWEGDEAPEPEPAAAAAESPTKAIISK